MTYRKQQGFSLVEVMTAMLISLFLVGGMVQVYISNKTTYRFGEALSRVQESGRFGLDYLATEIRMADFWGCTNLNTVSNDLDPAAPGVPDFLAGGLDGTEGGAGVPDSITIQGAFDRGINVQEPYMNTVSAALHVSDDSGIQNDDILLVSDCMAGDIFQVTNIQQGTGGNSGKESLNHNTGAGSLNVSGDLSKTYQGDAAVFGLMSQTFFIQNNPVGEPALFVTANGVTEELVAGVEDMQVLYGEDTDNNGVPNRFVDADNVGDMDEVTAVRISLVVRSFEDNVVDQPQVYILEGAPVAAGDRRMRQVFTTTISLRNRLN